MQLEAEDARSMQKWELAAHAADAMLKFDSNYAGGHYAKAWVAALCIDAVLLYVLRAARSMFATGPFIVDGSEKRIFTGLGDVSMSTSEATRFGCASAKRSATMPPSE